MKVNLPNLLIAIVLSATLAYGLWSFDNELKNYIAIGSFVFFTGTLGPLIGGRYEYVRNAVNLRVICGVFFLLGLLLNGMYAISPYSATSYMVISALFFLIFVFLANAIYGANQ